MRKNIKRTYITIILIGSIAVAAIADCSFGIKTTSCGGHAGNETPGTCNECLGWTVGPSLVYQDQCDTGNYEGNCSNGTCPVEWIHYGYVSGTASCPTTCGTVYEIDRIGWDCSAVDVTPCPPPFP